MLMVLYSMNDLVAESWDVPIAFENDMIAQARIMRECEIIAESDDNLKKKLLRDTVFEKVGYFDTQNGAVMSLNPDEPKVFVLGADLLHDDVEIDEEDLIEGVHYDS